MLADGGTGVSTYARTLLTAIELLDRPCGLLRGEPTRGRSSRAAMAAWPGSRRLRTSGADLIAPDIFRVAQAHFNLYGRVLRLRAPGPPGIMHWTYPIPLMIEGWANLYTVHDLIPLTHPALTPIAPARHRRLLEAVDRVADVIFTVSDAARDDILRVLRLSPGRVVNCSQAVVRTLPSEPLLEGHEPNGYLLFCGRVEARKNLTRLIAAHARSGCAMPLLIVGPIAEGGEAIIEIGRRSNPLMRYIPYVARSTLIGLIAQARALLLPSLAEGFGLPVVEAMALGTPTMVSRDRALVETAGGAALIVDETNLDAMAAAIAGLAQNDALCADLVTRGRSRVEAFAIERFADRLAAVYQGLPR